MHPTALKHLQMLKLCSLPAGCADGLTSSVLTKLPWLASLSLNCGECTSLRELPGLSGLTFLTELQLTSWGEGEMMDEDLELLRPLSQLRELRLGLAEQCSCEARQIFEASMPQLTSFWWQP
jgi:hypothetical protein